MGKRAAGILMPISSLPSDYGIGCFSKSAYEFVDWLKEAGQTYWQILPLGPTIEDLSVWTSKGNGNRAVQAFRNERIDSTWYCYKRKGSKEEG